ncbi:MAG: rhomboid family intramembrane serine protease [Candidatus Sumerlaeia bacterium]
MFFFFFPVGIARAVLRRPWVTWTFLLINIAVYFAPPLLQMDADAFLEKYAFNSLRFKEEPWRLVTYQFLHAGLLHLAFNMLYLYLVGMAVEDRIGHWRMAAIYLIGGVLAALGHHAVTPTNFLLEGPFNFSMEMNIPLVGASGSIAAIAGASVILMPWMDYKLFYVYFIFFIRIIKGGAGYYKCPGLLVLGIYFVVTNVFWGLFSLGVGDKGGVAYWAHLSGFGFGILVTALFYGIRPFFMTEEERMQEERQDLLGRHKVEKPKKPKGPIKSLDSKKEKSGLAVPQKEALLRHFIQIEDSQRAREEVRKLFRIDPDYELPEDIRKSLQELLARDSSPAPVQAQRPGPSPAKPTAQPPQKKAPESPSEESQSPFARRKRFDPMVDAPEDRGFWSKPGPPPDSSTGQRFSLRPADSPFSEFGRNPSVNPPDPEDDEEDGQDSSTNTSRD